MMNGYEPPEKPEGDKKEEDVDQATCDETHRRDRLVAFWSIRTDRIFLYPVHPPPPSWLCDNDAVPRKSTGKAPDLGEGSIERCDPDPRHSKY